MIFNETFTEYDIQLFLGSSGANKLMWTVFNSGFGYIVSNEVLPPTSPIKLDTSSLALIIPFL